MKRLFKVGTTFFEYKKDAKAYIKALNGKELGAKVTLGPDHWRYGLKGGPKTASHNARSGGAGTGFPKRRR